jgi:catechol 2,3-dioxygenase-like lactoylglutathione lyase family enzyme
VWGFGLRTRGGYARAVPLDLFAGVRVRDYNVAKSWYERLLGREPAFSPHATEAVWELAEHRYLFIVENRDAPGGATITVFVDDLDALGADIAARGIEPAERETYTNGFRKLLYRDADGNEIGFGGGPVEQ